MPISTELLVNLLTNVRMPYPNYVGEIFHIAIEDPKAIRPPMNTRIPIITVKAVLNGHRLEWRYVQD